MARAVSRIQREIKQTRPFRTKSQEAFLGLLRTTDLLRRLGTRRLEPFGITMQQYNVLRILRGAGPEGLPTLEVAERMVEQAPGVTRLLDRLEAKQLVSRERCPTDRRQVTCRIHAKGLALLSRLDPVMDALDDALGATLSQADLRALVRLLDQVRDRLATEE
jgi:DNA-binding MarR family transcriptional regulator